MIIGKTMILINRLIKMYIEPSSTSYNCILKHPSLSRALRANTTCLFNNLFIHRPTRGTRDSWIPVAVPWVP